MQSQVKARSVLVFCFCFVSLLSGHFWIYPEPIAKGWDATLAHLPYFQLKQQALDLLGDVKPNSIGSDFPNLRPPSEEYLEGPSHSIFKQKSLGTDTKVLYSNVFNGFSELDMDTLNRDFTVAKQWKSGQVNMILYDRKIN